jgi:hypothetical protein
MATNAFPSPPTLEQLRSAARVKFDSHAVSRMSTLHIGEYEVLMTLDRPIRRLPSGAGHPIDRIVFVGAEIRVVYAPHTRTVVTVTLNRVREYRHGVDIRPTSASRPTGCQKQARGREPIAPKSALRTC